jgi:TRAP-type transport system periplasmic protein
MRSTIGILVAVVTVAVAAGSVGAPAAFGQTPVVMKFATVHPPAHPFTKGAEFFAKRVKELTGNAITVQVYGAGQLGNERDLLEGIQIGTVEGAVATTAVLGNFNKEFEVFSLPFLFNDSDHVRQTFEGPIGQKYAQKLSKLNMVSWKCWVVGPRGVYGKKVVRTLADVKGLKVRTLESPIFIDTWKALGSIPSPIAWGEVYTALQTGLVDAAEGSMLGLVTAKHGEVAKFYADLEYVISGNAVVISNQFLSKQPPKNAQAIRSALDETSRLVKELFDAQDAETLRQVQQEYKVTITKPEKGPFRDAVKSIYAKYDAQRQDINEILARK